MRHKWRRCIIGGWRRCACTSRCQNRRESCPRNAMQRVRSLQSEFLLRFVDASHLSPLPRSTRDQERSSGIYFGSECVGDPNTRPTVIPDKFSQLSFFISFRVVSRYSNMRKLWNTGRGVVSKFPPSPLPQKEEKKKKEKEPIARKVESAFGLWTRYSFFFFALPPVSYPSPPPFLARSKKVKELQYPSNIPRDAETFSLRTEVGFASPKMRGETRFNQHCGTLSAHRVARA